MKIDVKIIQDAILENTKICGIMAKYISEKSNRNENPIAKLKELLLTNKHTDKQECINVILDVAKGIIDKCNTEYDLLYAFTEIIKMCMMQDKCNDSELIKQKTEPLKGEFVEPGKRKPKIQELTQRYFVCIKKIEYGSGTECKIGDVLTCSHRHASTDNLIIRHLKSSLRFGFDSRFFKEIQKGMIETEPLFLCKRDLSIGLKKNTIVEFRKGVKPDKQDYKRIKTDWI